MSRQVSLTSCLAKMYESNLDSAGGAGKSPSRSSAAGGSNLSSLDKKLNLLNDKVDKLLNFQEDVMEKLGTVHQGIDDLEKGIDKLKVISMPDNLRREAEGGLNNADGNMDGVCTEILRLVKNVHHDTLKQGERLLGVEKMVSAVDKAIVFIGETFKNSTVVDFILKGIVPWKKGSLSEVPDEIKDKPEVKGTRPKNALSSRGVQVDVRRAVEEPKTGKKLDGNNGKCEQVDWRTTEVSDADSGPPPEKKQPDPQMVRPPEGTSSPRDAHGKASKKDRDPPGDPDPSGRQNPAAHEEAKPRRAASEGSPGKAAPAPGTSFPHAASSASSPRAPKADCHPLLPRFSSTAPKADARETISTTSVKSQDNMVGECTKEKGPLRLRAEAQEDGRCQEKLKHSKCHKDSRTDPQTEEKEARSEGKQDPQVLKEGKLQTHFCKPSVEKVVKEKADHKCKALTHLSSSDRDRRSEAAGPGQSLQEPPEATKLLAKDSGHQKPQSETPLTDRMENETSQCVAQGQAVDNSTASGTDALVIDDSPPPPAPFVHRIVSVKPAPLTTCYAICQHEVLGGGRFGQVHKCTEVSSGLSLAAKIIKVKGAKDREEVKNEINVMNQLNHVNLIQLFDAFEGKNSITLIVEYVDGGELFDRITDENYNLTELDAILFTKQICEGVYYLHQQYILHLDLKPENILCVNRTGNQIKIIDFGLARRYKPREKLKVNFGTPEFLAPEVVNYDFVSFPTDMWSVGVITYMLLSGLSPFLGESDTETMNFIVNCNWDFDADAFEQVSEEAKDFILQLLVKEKSCRISATQCLKHKWLNDLPAKAKKFRVRLKSQVSLQRYLAQRKWKKHFYAVTAAYRLRKLQRTASVNPA